MELLAQFDSRSTRYHLWALHTKWHSMYYNASLRVGSSPFSLRRCRGGPTITQRTIHSPNIPSIFFFLPFADGLSYSICTILPIVCGILPNLQSICRVTVLPLALCIYSLSGASGHPPPPLAITTRNISPSMPDQDTRCPCRYST